jgi:itaconyl-CoA hydratase
MTDVERAGGRCFEDFRPGMLIRHSLGRTVTKTDNIWFTLLTTNTNPSTSTRTTRRKRNSASHS